MINFEKTLKNICFQSFEQIYVLMIEFTGNFITFISVEFSAYFAIKKI